MHQLLATYHSVLVLQKSGNDRQQVQRRQDIYLVVI